jgi:hypothetical protein
LRNGVLHAGVIGNNADSFNFARNIHLTPRHNTFPDFLLPILDGVFHAPMRNT